MAHAAAMPKSVFSGTARTATVIVSSDRGLGVRLDQRREVGAPAVLEGLREYRRQRHDQEAGQEQ